MSNDELNRQLSDAVARRESLRTELIELAARLPDIRAAFGNPFFYSNPEHADEAEGRFTAYSSHSVIAPTIMQLKRIHGEVTRLTAELVSHSDAERLSVFVQNEAGSDQKNYHDEQTLLWQRAVRVSRPYPFPYGFIIGTAASDGCCVDCFVLTQRNLKTGNIVTCEPVGLMEQFEDGHIDHNVLGRPVGEQPVVTNDVQVVLTEFVHRVFEHIPDKHIAVGRFLGVDAAVAHVASHSG